MYKPIPFYSLANESSVHRPAPLSSERVSLDDPAIEVMTDLSKVMPVTILPTATIDTANHAMIACGVRMLFVTDENGVLQGLITATDILGEKPLRYLQENGGARDLILVQHIMTPKEKLQALHMREVVNARVGDMVETLKSLGRHHMLVTEEGPTGTHVRGLFSTSQIGRQLGMELDPYPRTQTFAELEQALVHGIEADSTP